MSRISNIWMVLVVLILLATVILFWFFVNPYIGMAPLAVLCILGFVVTKWVLKYLFWHDWYFKDMKSEFDKLEQKRDMMLLKLDEANYLCILEHDVEAWIERVYETEKSVHKILEEKEKIRDRHLNLKSHYILSKKSEKITWDIVKLFSEGRSNTMAIKSPLSSRELTIHIAEENPTKTEVIIDTPSAPTQLNRRFTLHEVESATHNFDVALIIGKGGFGKVYKGFIDDGATMVAVKRRDPMSNQGDTEFRNEIKMLCRFRHCNLVSLIGYCDDDSEKILVYEYMINGSLADHLHPKGVRNGNRTVLCWVQRVKICLGAARAIEYLHSGTSVLHKVIHQDVKSSNILLDEIWAAKVSDFGLSKIGPASGSCTGINTKVVQGTAGYCDPEYLWTHRLTSKSDVYAFGVVLIEVLSGSPALDFSLPKEKRGLAVRARKCIEENTIHELIDPNLKWEIHSNSLKAFVDIAEKCLQVDPKKRPKMAEVVASLELALASQMSTDSSLLAPDIFDFHSTCDNQENFGSSGGVSKVENVLVANVKKQGSTLEIWNRSINLPPKKRYRRRASLSQGKAKKTKQGNKLEKEDKQSLIEFAVMNFTKQDPYKIKKPLTKSDVDGNSRLLLKCDCVEKYSIPYMDEIQAQLRRKIDGVSFRVFDVDDDSLHQLHLKKWENTGYFVKRKNLQIGDQIRLVMFRGRLFFKLLKKNGDY